MINENAKKIIKFIKENNSFVETHKNFTSCYSHQDAECPIDIICRRMDLETDIERDQNEVKKMLSENGINVRGCGYVALLIFYFIDKKNIKKYLRCYNDIDFSKLTERYLPCSSEENKDNPDEDLDQVVSSYGGSCLWLYKRFCRIFLDSLKDIEIE